MLVYAQQNQNQQQRSMDLEVTITEYFFPFLIFSAPDIPQKIRFQRNLKM